jgi:hypothetical protein
MTMVNVKERERGEDREREALSLLTKKEHLFDE